MVFGIIGDRYLDSYGGIMMEIIREKDSLGFYEIKMIKGESRFTICFGGNGDLYWDILNLDDMDSKDEFFTIDKGDGEVYNLFYKLFKNVSEHQVFHVNDVEKSYCNSEDEVRKLEIRNRMFNEELSSHPYFRDLCNGQYIEWHSDNEPFETGNRLTVFLDEEKGEIMLEINRVSREYDFLNVAFSHSGSRYSPFDLAFYEHYSAMCEMELGKKTDEVEEVKKLVKKDEQ